MKEKKIDLLSGNLLKNMIVFALPIMMSGVLQLLFSAADLVVVGKFDLASGSEAQAAVGSTGSLINLITNLFLGMAVGANVAVARYIGSKRHKDITASVRTAMTIALLSGIVVAAIGFTLAEPMLVLMKSDPKVLPLAVKYLKIYFLGAPFMMLYNFGSGIMRAAGNTTRPMIYLSVAGVINVLLNMLTIIVFDMSITGVAIATVSSQIISAICVVYYLLTTKQVYRLELKGFKISWEKVGMIVKIGLPAGIQGSLFSISNVIIQSSINSFGSTVMAGNGNALNIEGFVYIAMSAFMQVAITFNSQFYGAKMFDKLKGIFIRCQGLVFSIGLVLGLITFFFAKPLMGIYTNDPDVTAVGVSRMQVFGLTYFLAGMMDVMSGTLRGLGYSFVPMVVSLIGICGFRIVWIYTIFQKVHTLECLYMSYPVTWVITFAALFIYYLFAMRKIKRQYLMEQTQNEITTN